MVQWCRKSSIRPVGLFITSTFEGRGELNREGKLDRERLGGAGAGHI